MNKPIDPTNWLVAMAAKIEAEGPQTVDVAGHGRVTLIAETEFRRLNERKPSFKEWLLTGPRLDDVEIERDPRPSRDFSF